MSEMFFQYQEHLVVQQFDSFFLICVELAFYHRFTLQISFK
jgi:hypothetical protein